MNSRDYNLLNRNHKSLDEFVNLSFRDLRGACLIKMNRILIIYIVKYGQSSANPLAVVLWQIVSIRFLSFR